MFDTRTTVVGNVLTKPELKVIEKSGALVANFRVIATSRHRGPDGQWADGPSFRVRVNCWRKLADHVVVSINVGDPIIVYGRLVTRDWKTEQGEVRTSYELDADNVGHDLAKGVDVFTKMRHEGSTSVVEDAETENRIGGEVTRAFLEPGRVGADEPHGDGYDESYDSSVVPDTAEDAIAILRGAGLDPAPGDEEDVDEEDLVGAAAGSGGSAGRSRRRGR